MFSVQNISVVLQFGIATLLPVVAATVLTTLSRKSRLSSFTFWQRQLLFGLIFGLIAVFGTEFGINTQGATMNVRDAAPIVAGLYFGGPAGIIAGIIGGVERWFSVLWGRGMFTRVACSIATCVSGIYAAALNHYLFDERKPSWPLAFAIGMVAEVLHLLLVFVTNFNEATRAFLVVQTCSLPMILCNGISVALAGAAVAYASGHSLRHQTGIRNISQTIQTGMLGVVGIGFVATVGFMFALQHNISISNTRETLLLEINDTKEDIHDASDSNLLAIAHEAAGLIPSVSAVDLETLVALTKQLDVSEIHIIDAQGIIVASSDDSYIDFDMNSGEQSRGFLDLLPSGRASYIVQDYQPMTMDSSIWRKFAGVRIEGGFLQVSYDSGHFVDDIASQVQTSVANRHVGNDGLLVVLSEDGKLVGTRSDMAISNKDAELIFDIVEKSEPDTLLNIKLKNEDYYATQQGVEGFYIVALLPVAEATLARNLSVLVISFMEVLVFAALFAAIYLLIKNVVVRSIWEVNGTLDQITSGDLEAEVNVRDSSEFASLSDDINKTVTSLRNAIAAESARIEQDLRTAKAIQESALPRTFPPFPDVDAFDIFASMNAAREVGGDFYDFFLIDDHTLGFLIADVSGKGIPASLFMMAAKSELANYMKSGMELSEAVHSANCNLCQNNDAGMFVTVWAATLDYNTGRLTYVNAGHNPPLLRHNGSWEWLRKKCGLFLGVFDTAKYRSATIDLHKGDELLLYTDGVNEAFSVNEEEYGNQRLEDFLNAHADQHPHMLVDMLRADVRHWALGAEQSDDITMLCLEYGKQPEVSGNITVCANSDGLGEIMRYLHFDLSQIQCPDATQRQIDLVIEELFANVCQHGYAGFSKPGQVQVAYIYNTDASTIAISVTDWGIAFDPIEYDGPKKGVGDEVTGMGIALALEHVDDIAYIRDEDRNVVAFVVGW